MGTEPLDFAYIGAHIVAELERFNEELKEQSRDSIANNKDIVEKINSVKFESSEKIAAVENKLTQKITDVNSELSKDVNTKLTENNKQINANSSEISNLKVKVSVYGAIAAFIVTVIVNLVIAYLGRK